MSHVFPRHTKVKLPIVKSGKGVYLYDSQNKVYLDGSGGAAVSCLGHGNQKVTQAIKNQLDQIAFAHTGFFTSEPAEHLAAHLVNNAPGDIDKVYLVSGGSEAVEAALKLARQYFVERNEPQRKFIISRRQSYHGNTLGALASSGNAWRREQFAPLLIQTSHVSPCYAYRDQQDNETAEQYGERLAIELESEILKLGSDQVIAFIAESVVGATAGALTPVPGYFKRIREICDRYGVLLILDEVMCGMGRTGTFFAYEQESIQPDIVTIAKGLGAGYQPIGAMLCSRQIYQTIEAGTGFFQHGHTYLGHPVACAAGLAVVKQLTEDGLVSRCAAQGAKLFEALTSEFQEHPYVGDIRGRGLFLGLEFVQDKFKKIPFNPELAIHKKIKQAAFDAGLVCYPMGGTVNGKLGDHVLIAPPFIISDDQIDELVTKLSFAIKAVLA